MGTARTSIISIAAERPSIAYLWRSKSLVTRSRACTSSWSWEEVSRSSSSSFSSDACGATPFSYTLAATSFLPLWLALVVGNLWVGVLHAGYGIREELPILAVNFAVPAVVAFAAAWYFARP